MKKLLLVLFAAGLIAAFSMPAVAADVKFFGDYYVYGGLEKNHSLIDNEAARNLQNGGRGTKEGVTAVGQRLRINTIFQVAEGLKLTTRFDVMERVWGQEVPAPSPGILDRSEKNISWERAFVTFNLGPGFFDVGYQGSGYFSPIAFGNSTSSAPGIRYTSAFGPVTLSAYWLKSTENTTPLGDGPVVIFTPNSATASASTSTGNTYAYSSGDRDNYALEGTFKWKSGQAGLKVLYVADERNNGQYGWISEDTGGPVVTYTGASVRYWEFTPFVQAKLGPVDLEAKLYYDYGTADFRNAATPDVDLKGLSYYANGKVNIGPAYVGAMYAYIQGDNDPTDDTLKVGHSGGQDWDPCLIIGNDRYFKWMGGLYRFAPRGYATASAFPAWYAEQNAKFIQGYVGVNPIPKLALKASFTNVRQDYHSYGVSASKDIGNELDITAAYKIYPNLEYMVGFGYWWVGDYFQGSSAANSIDNNYLLMHQLTLTF